MDKELGAAKAEHWRVANACPWRPDSLTGSKDPDHIEWGVPMEWERLTEKDLKQLIMKNKGEADEDDFKLTFGYKVAESSEVIKEEPALSPDEQREVEMKKEVATLMSNLPSVIRRFQDTEMDVKMMHAKSLLQKKKYATNFQDDLNKLQCQITKFIKLLQKIMVDTSASQAEMPNVIKTMKGLETEYTETYQWAVTFSCAQSLPKRRRVESANGRSLAVVQ